MSPNAIAWRRYLDIAKRFTLLLVQPHRYMYSHCSKSTVPTQQQPTSQNYRPVVSSCQPGKRALIPCWGVVTATRHNCGFAWPNRRRTNKSKGLSMLATTLSVEISTFDAHVEWTAEADNQSQAHLSQPSLVAEVHQLQPLCLFALLIRCGSRCLALLRLPDIHRTLALRCPLALCSRLGNSGALGWGSCAQRR